MNTFAISYPGETSPPAWLLVQVKVPRVGQTCFEKLALQSHLPIVWPRTRSTEPGKKLGRGVHSNKYKCSNNARMVGEMLQGQIAAEKRITTTTITILTYSAWNIWKEHSRRNFEGLTRLPLQVFGLIKEEIATPHKTTRATVFPVLTQWFYFVFYVCDLCLCASSYITL